MPVIVDRCIDYATGVADGYNDYHHNTTGEDLSPLEYYTIWSNALNHCNDPQA